MKDLARSSGPVGRHVQDAIIAASGRYNLQHINNVGIHAGING